MTVSKRENIVAVGMGRMGRGIAISFACAGYSIALLDLKSRSTSDYTALRTAAEAEIMQTLRMLADFGLFEVSSVDIIASRVSYADTSASSAALAHADIVFEGVPETLEAKTSALQIISQAVNESAIIASTTSTMLSDELQSLVIEPQRFLNAHWLNPAFLVPLVEVSPGKLTGSDVTDRLKSVLEGIGKVPVVCAASPGYIVPRIQALAMNEAARMVEEGVATAEDIDKATRYGFGFRFAILGLLEFIDWGGGDILYHASRYMEEATGDARHRSPDIIADNMKDGRIGLRTQKGFLDYQNMDVDQYQRDRLSAFVQLLKHIDKLPNTVT